MTLGLVVSMNDPWTFIVKESILCNVEIRICPMLYSAVRFRQSTPFALNYFVKQSFIWILHIIDYNNIYLLSKKTPTFTWQNYSAVKEKWLEISDIIWSKDQRYEWIVLPEIAPPVHIKLQKYCEHSLHVPESCSFLTSLSWIQGNGS